jgi:prepilin-type N-terminal cleavage/methylation domain-containing protein
MNRKNGFTLIEILIALTIFLVGSIGVISLFGIAASSQTRAINYSAAARLAEDVFANLQAKMYESDTGESLLKANQVIPENIPKEDEAFLESSFYKGYSYKVVFFNISNETVPPNPDPNWRPNPEILAVLYVRWFNEGSDFRVGEKKDSDPPNNYEGRVFTGVILKKPW